MLKLFKSFLTIILMSAVASSAATIDWSNTAATPTWANGANWIGGVPPSNDLSTDTARFNQSSYLNQPNTGTTSVGGIITGNGLSATGPLGISGTALSIGAAGITANANAGFTTIHTPVTLGATQTWSNYSANALSLLGSLSGSFALTKAGAGTLNLAATLANYSGSTTLSGGTINILHGPNTSPMLGMLTFASGDGAVASTFSSGTNSLAFSSLASRTPGATGNLIVTGGTNGSTNKIVLAAQATDALIDKGVFFGGSNFAWYAAGGFVRGINYGSDANTSTVAGGTSLGAGTDVQMTAPITAQNTTTINTLSMTGAANNNLALSGSLQVLTVGAILKSGGTLAQISSGFVDNGGTDLVVRADSSGDNLTIANVIQGAGGLVKSGVGTLTLSGANTFGGSGKSIYVNAGILSISTDTRLGDSNNALVLNGGNLTISSNSFTLRSFSIGSGASPNVTYTGGSTKTVTFSPISGDGNLTFSGADNGASNNSFALSTGNTFGGPGRILTVGGLRNDGVTATSAGFTVSATADSCLGNSNNSLAMGTSGTFRISGTTYSSTSRSLIMSGSGTFDINNAVNNFTWNGPISGAGTITKSDVNNTMTLNSSMSAFTGGLTVNGGTLLLGSNYVAPTAGFGLFTLLNTSLNSPNLDMNNYDFSAAGLVSASPSTVVIKNSDANAYKTLTLNKLTAQRQYFGVIGVAGSSKINVLKQGANEQVVAGPSTYSGSTTVEGGQLSFGGTTAQGTALSTSSLVVRGGGILQNGSGTAASNTGERLNIAAPVTLGGTNFGGGTYTMGLTSAATTLSGVSFLSGVSTINYTSVTGTLGNGAIISGTGIPAGTVITAFTGTTITLSATTTANNDAGPYATSGIVQRHTVLTVNPGANTITSTGTGTTPTVVRFTDVTTPLARTAGSTLNVASTANLSVNFSTTPMMTNGVIGSWATFGGGDYAVVSGSGPYTLGALSAAANNDASTWASSSNINISTVAVTNFSGTKTINTLRNTSTGGIFSLASGTLETNGILQSGTTATLQITTGTITAPNNELVILGNVAFGLSIGALIQGNGGGNTVLTASTSNSVTLANAGNKISDVYINAGTVISSASKGLGVAAGTIYLYASSLNPTAVQSYSTANSNAKAIVVSGASKIFANMTNATDVASFDNANITLNDGSALTMGNPGNNNSKGTITLNQTGGKITGPGALTYGAGSGATFQTTFNIYGSNDYTGGTTFAQGNSGSGSFRVNFNTSSAFGIGTIFIGPGSNSGLALESLQALSANLTISNPIRSQLSNTASFFVLGGPSTSDFTLSGPISLETANLTGFTVNSGRTITISGSITETGGSRPIAVVGPGSLLLSGVNAYTGVTTVRSGTLLVGANSPASAPGALGNASSAVMLADASSATGDNVSLLTNSPIAIGRDLTINNNNTTGITTLGGNSADASVFSGAISLNKDVKLTAATSGSVNFSGIISGGFAVEKLNPGLVTLSGADTYSGSTTVTAGTLNIMNTNTTSGVTIAAGATLRGTGSLTGTTGAISFSGAGTVFPGDATASALTNGPLGNLSAKSADFGTNGGKMIIRVKSTGPGNATADSLTLTANSGTPLMLSGSSKLELHIQNPSINYPTNQDVVIVDNSAGANLNMTTFNAVTVTTGAVTNITVLYVDSTFTLGGSTGIVATQAIPTTTEPTPSGGYNRIVVRFSGNVTPVKVADFNARSETFGANISWTAVSEFQNAGFNLYRRAIEGSAWKKVNPALIAGRVTNADELTYNYFDWAAPGMYEYKLESVALNGARDVHDSFSNVVSVDWNSNLAPVSGVTPESVAGAESSINVEAGVKLAVQSLRQFAVMKAADAGSASESARAQTSKRPVSAREVAVRSVEQSVAGQLPPRANASVAVRWFSSANVGAKSSFSTAKVTYTGGGVMLIPQASMPAGCDLNHVLIQREGRNVTALAQVPGGLLVHAPGYKDDYTNKDALFLRNTSASTKAGGVSNASNLFSSALPVQVATSSSVTNDYHDVYFDYANSFRPYTFEPWFSSKYLTSGSAQNFTVSLPHAAGAPGEMVVNLWSLTAGDHTLQLAINGQAVGEASWNGGQKMMQLSFSAGAGVLKSGDNVVTLSTPVLPGSTEQTCFVHSIKVGYTRNLDASAPFEITNDSGVEQLFELNNVPASGVWVVDTRFSDRAALVPTESQPQADGSLRVRFKAAAGGSGKFVVGLVGAENRPLSVTSTQIKALRLNGSYLATGPAQFASGVQPLLMKRSKEGIRSAFVDQEQLFDYYNYGRYGPDGIRNAVRSTRPTYLLLVGRTTYDYLNYEGQNVDPLCPAYLVSTSFWAQSTSDSAFGDLGRGYPEVAVGRLPVNNPTELSGAVNHIIGYKGIPASGARLHAVADKTDPSVANFGGQLDTTLKARHSEFAWQENYLEKTYQTSPEVTAALNTAANGGADLILYSGHGNAARLGAGAPSILDQNSVQEWKGNTVFLQATCTANWMAKNVNDYKSIAIQALTQAQGGIAASVGTSTYMNSDVATAFMNQLLTNTNQPGARWGSALLKTQRWAGAQTGSEFYKDLMKTEQLFGDPAMPVFSPGAGAQVQSSTQPGTF